MHPPFGFALFYLRSVSYVDKMTGRTMPPVTTGQIYWGAVPFVLIQCVMVALLIAAPGLVRHDTAPVPRAAPAHYAPGAPQKAQGQGLSLPPYPPTIAPRP